MTPVVRKRRIASLVAALHGVRRDDVTLAYADAPDHVLTGMRVLIAVEGGAVALRVAARTERECLLLLQHALENRCRDAAMALARQGGTR